MSQRQAAKTAIFPGSFDPFTNGHVDIVERALSIFDVVVVAIIQNPAKSALFTGEQRQRMIAEIFKDRGDRVQVECFGGLLVDYLRNKNTSVVLRGLRAISDYDYETQMALMNKHLYPAMETLFLVAREEHSYVSSTLVRQVAPLGGDVSRLVPAVVLAALKAKFGR